MTTYTFILAIDARRSKDTEALAQKIEPIFREVTGLGDRDMRWARVAPRKRGGAVRFDAEVEHESRDAAVAAVEALGEAISTSANLVDRVDEFSISLTVEGKFVGFSTGDFRGWMREDILDELRAARA